VSDPPTPDVKTGTNVNDPASRVGQSIEGRRLQLGMSKAELARRAHLSESTVHKAISGSLQLGEDSLRKLDGALGWPTGTLEAVLDGADPPPDAVSDPDRLARLEARLDRLAADLAAAHTALDRVLDLLGKGNEPCSQT
jgi:transcriptional regulator with XRE-family HTH domain